MNPKTYLENRIRGWLPKEPSIQTYQRTCSNIWRTPRRGIAIIFLGGSLGGLLGAFSSYIGLNQGIGVYLWPITIGITWGIITAAILIGIKPKEEQQRSEKVLKP